MVSVVWMEGIIVKGLIANVYRWSLGDCTLGGISSKYDELIILPTESTRKAGIEIPGIFLPNEDFPAIYIFHRPQFGDLIASYEDYGIGGPWYMFGGNFIYSSDSRFPAKHPIKVFDRREN